MEFFICNLAMIVIGCYQQGQQKPVNTCSAKAKVQLWNDKYKCYRGKKGKQGTLGCDKPRTTFIPAQDDNGDSGGDDNGDGFGNGDGGFDDDSNDGDDIQVPMNRVVVGTAPSPNLTVSQAR